MKEARGNDRTQMRVRKNRWDSRLDNFESGMSEKKNGTSVSRVGRKRVTRRAFVGLGAAAVLSLAIGPRLAWGEVGSGAWGSRGGWAHPGSHFGFKAGWSYSYDECVWLSASCDCTVGRMTELFVEIRVDAYVACGGIWTPTWSPDIPDTPTYAYIRDDAGTWMASAFWNIDTTYDHDYYAYMTGTSLRVSRQAWDWRCWCGADIKGLGGSAPGTHSVAEADQWIPHHVLVDDSSWHGKIVTLRPRSAEHLRMDALNGGMSAGSDVRGWSSSDKTNQNWIVLRSAQGRTCFVPVHVGGSPLFLDVKGGDWKDGTGIQLYRGNGGLAQSYWLHDLGTGYHLIIPECSGCALDLNRGGQADGTEIIQWNCYGNWGDSNQHWKLEEVLFRERSKDSMTIDGKPESGEVLAPSDPRERCLPSNFAGTTGMYYQYAWYRGKSKGDRAELVQAFSEDSAYLVEEKDEGKFLTCVVKAFARYGNVPYKGEVATQSVQVALSRASIRFFSDDDAKPCWQVSVKKGSAFVVPEEAWKAAVKKDCSGIEGWYSDKEHLSLFLDGTAVNEDLDLYARNRIALEYEMASSSCVAAETQAYFLDPSLTQPLGNPRDLLPLATEHYVGERVSFAQGSSVWYEDMGSVREAACAVGAFAEADAGGSPLLTARLTKNTLVYLCWRVPAYDGIALQ